MPHDRLLRGLIRLFGPLRHRLLDIVPVDVLPISQRGQRALCFRIGVPSLREFHYPGFSGWEL